MSYFELEPEEQLNPVKMLMDAIRWNMLNVIRVELFFNCYRIWNIFIKASLQSPRGQYAIVSLLITILAHLAVQFNFGLLLTLYSVYLITGMGVWLHRRVYFYHRRLDSVGVNLTIDNFNAAKSSVLHHNGGIGGGNSNGGTLKHDKHSSSQSSSSSSSVSAGSDTNSLQRQRALAYRDFQSVLNEPRRNHREFAMSLAHLSHASKLVADKDVFDEMHFQVLATRRDVVNIILRSALLAAATLLAYF